MINSISFYDIQPAGSLFNDQQVQEKKTGSGSPTFLDVFKEIAVTANEQQEIKAQDMLDLMLGDVDDLERIQTNVTKAQVSLELLTNVRNATLEAYNEIIKMQI